MEVYPLVLPPKVKISLEGLQMLCLRWWNRKGICRFFKWIEEKYGGFKRTQTGANLRCVCTNGRRREPRRGVGKNQPSYK